VSDDTEVTVIRHTGSCPVVVEFSDGTHSAYFCGDLPAYKKAVESGEYPPDRTFHGEPPAIGATLATG